MSAAGVRRHRRRNGPCSLLETPADLPGTGFGLGERAPFPSRFPRHRLSRLLLSYGDERQVTHFGSDTRGRSRVVRGGHTRHQHHLLGHPVWFSILGALPFALLLPHANLFWTGILAVLIAMIMASAFSAILVYAQELLPGRVGLAAGMFYGFSFGLGGLGAAALGKLADLTSITTVYRVCPFLLLLGLLTAFLPRRPGAPSLHR